MSQQTYICFSSDRLRTRAGCIRRHEMESGLVLVGPDSSSDATVHAMHTMQAGTCDVRQRIEPISWIAGS
jgi:hypothetical protein